LHAADSAQRGAPVDAAASGRPVMNQLRVTWPGGGTAQALAAVVATGPLVHCLTNIVVAGFTANVLLALGASPAMVENACEAGPFASISGGVLINLGTLSPERESAMRAAAEAASRAGRPWVLDPVAVGVLEHRTRLASELLAWRPAVVRGNPSEVMSLAGCTGAQGKGVDSATASEQAVEAASDLARRSGAVVAVSGAVDYITDGAELVAVPDGDPMMAKVTGVGCALGAVMAAFLAAGAPPLLAATGASALMGAAGSRAARGGPGPGTFAVRLIDHLAGLAESVRP